MHLLARLADHEPAILQEILERVAERADREPWLLLSVAGTDAAMRAALSDDSPAWSTARGVLGLEEGPPAHEQLRAWCESTHSGRKRIRRMRIARAAHVLTRHLVFFTALHSSVSWLAKTAVRRLGASSLRSTYSPFDFAAIGITTLLSTATMCGPRVLDGARALMYARKGL